LPSARNNGRSLGPCSLAVEHPLGKGEVTSSILVMGSIYQKTNWNGTKLFQSPDSIKTVSLGNKTCTKLIIDTNLKEK
jgi:hypothetical protein